MGELDRLIHEPARLVIIALLSQRQKADFLYLLRQSGLTRPGEMVAAFLGHLIHRRNKSGRDRLPITQSAVWHGRVMT